MDEMILCKHLEQAIDAGTNVVEMIETICWEKAERIRRERRNEDLARLWHRAAIALGKVHLPG